MDRNQVDSLNSEQSLALETAWQRYAQLETNASAALKQYLSLRVWAMVLAVVATLLAVVTGCTDTTFLTPTIAKVLKATLILVPIVSLVILVFANKLQQGQYWQILRTGAAEIEKEIYFYRTLLQGQPKRHQWLNDRVTDVQRHVSESLGGNLVLQSYTGTLPPDDFSDEQTSRSGFSDLLADNYLRDRIETQLQAYSQALTNLHTTRTRLKIGIFALGVLSAFFPVLGDRFNIWVTLTTSLMTALISWLELRRLDASANNYNQLILELNIIRDHWQSLSLDEQTGDEFFKLVTATEKVLWSQHNQPIIQMRQAVADLQRNTSDLLTQVMNQPAPSDITKALQKGAGDWGVGIGESSTGIIGKQCESNSTSPQPLTPNPLTSPQPLTPSPLPSPQPLAPSPLEEKTVKKGLPHAFVVMPFGRKKGPDGRWIDFDSIYQQLIKPALEESGFESFRADEEAVSGDILTDMFQELLLADLVLADLSIDNANVFYELGVRHALRKRGLIHIQCGRAYMPYDIFNVRTIPYHCDEEGRPDPLYLDKDKQAIIKMARATWESEKHRIHSPIFNLLTGLCEPDRKTLQTPLATGYWQEYKEWKERVAIAKRKNWIGDVLLLTEEVSNPLLKEEAIAEAGRALVAAGNHTLALKEYREGLKINPQNSEFRRQEAFNLNRLKQSDEAIVKLEGLLQDEPSNCEAISNLARIYKEKWKDEWVNVTDEQERLKAAYEAVHLMIKAIQTYLKAYRLNQDDYYPGINALLLSAALEHLVQQLGTDGDLEEEALRQQLPSLKGAIQFSLESAAKTDDNNYWLFVSLGDLAVCTAQDPKQVTRAYKKALTLAGKSKFAVKSCLGQLEFLEALRFRPEYVQAGVAVFKAELKRFDDGAEVSSTPHQPPQVFLFSGHMIDNPKRSQPRFPAKMENEAKEKIEEVMDKLHPTSNCLAIAPGIACGGDILFLEACLRRNMKVEVFLPFESAEFIRESVDFAGDKWVTRFYAIQNHPNVSIHFQPERLGEVPKGENAFERNNRWAFYSTLMYGIERVRLIALWDGKEGFAGGTGDMVQEVRRLGGIVEHIDTTKFEYWKAKGNVMDSIYRRLMDEEDRDSDKVSSEA